VRTGAAAGQSPRHAGAPAADRWRLGDTRGMPPRSSAPRPHLSTSPFRPQEPGPPAERYAVNDRVNHDRYGMGIVVSTEGDAWVTARFGSELVRVANGPKLAKL
jgi:hypothetical protein